MKLLLSLMLLCNVALAQNLTTSSAYLTVTGAGELDSKVINAINPLWPVALYFYKVAAPSGIGNPNMATYVNNTSYNSITVATYSASIYSQYSDSFRFYNVSGGSYIPGDIYIASVEYMSAGTSTVTVTPTNTATFTPTRTMSATFSATRTKTATQTFTQTKTATPTFTASITPSVTPTFTITPSRSVSPSKTVTPNPTRTLTLTSTATPTATPTVTPTRTP